MTKPVLAIQIPCLNEQEGLPRLLNALRQVNFDCCEKVLLIVIDDGSSDETVAIAKRFGVTSIISHPSNLGLARSFMDGLSEALRLGADIVVNIDGDCQYQPEEIPALIAPIIERRADVVIGDRQTMKLAHFSPLKRLTQVCGSTIISLIAGVAVRDVVCGFRAFSSEAARKIRLNCRLSHTVETIVQCRPHGLRIAQIPVTSNAPLRESRLISSPALFVARCALITFQSLFFFNPKRARHLFVTGWSVLFALLIALSSTTAGLGTVGLSLSLFTTGTLLLSLSLGGAFLEAGAKSAAQQPHLSRRLDYCDPNAAPGVSAVEARSAITLTPSLCESGSPIASGSLCSSGTLSGSRTLG